jgi:hypothetical protein
MNLVVKGNTLHYLKDHTALFAAILLPRAA